MMTKLLTSIVIIIFIIITLSFIEPETDLIQVTKTYQMFNGAGKEGRALLSNNYCQASELEYLDCLKQNIYPAVIDYVSNDHFILAIQNPNNEGHIAHMILELTMYFPAQKAKSLAYSLIKNEEYYQTIFTNELNYWIIEIDTNSIYGPYSREEFSLKKEKLGVSQELELKEK